VTHQLVRLAASALVLLLGSLCGGCTSEEAHSEPPSASTVPSTSSTSSSPAAAVPSSAAELESLLVDEVPSGLPAVPDDELDPPAGEKSIEDVAQYGDDPAEQRAVLEDYGYLRGWERFWRSGDALTSVFIDQFRGPDGAGSYAEDLARNDADYYGGALDDSPACSSGWPAPLPSRGVPPGSSPSRSPPSPGARPPPARSSPRSPPSSWTGSPPAERGPAGTSAPRPAAVAGAAVSWPGSAWCRAGRRR
jgi:hypothetical protein